MEPGRLLSDGCAELFYQALCSGKRKWPRPQANEFIVRSLQTLQTPARTSFLRGLPVQNELYLLPRSIVLYPACPAALLAALGDHRFDVFTTPNRQIRPVGGRIDRFGCSQSPAAHSGYFFVDVKVPRLKSWTRRLSAAVGLDPSIGYSCPTPTANSRSGSIAKVVARASLMASARSWLS